MTIVTHTECDIPVQASDLIIWGGVILPAGALLWSEPQVAVVTHTECAVTPVAHTEHTVAVTTHTENQV